MNDYKTELDDLVSETESNIYNVEKLIYTNRYNFLPQDFKLISKQSLVILYSLWEGFVQESFQIFLKEVDANINSLYQLNEGFMLSQIEIIFKQFQNYPSKEVSKMKFHRRLNEFALESNHQLNTIVNCKNNVEIDVLNNLFNTYGMEPIPHNWEDYCHPNNNLKTVLKDFLHYRNNQAHGNRITANVVIEHNEFIIYKKLVIDLLFEVSRKLEKCLIEKTYLKQETP
ncbi:MAG: MAE_28990/MAE_18760 family HEPN-like nuclease [Psychrobacter nivimaris]